MRTLIVTVLAGVMAPFLAFSAIAFDGGYLWEAGFWLGCGAVMYWLCCGGKWIPWGGTLP